MRTSWVFAVAVAAGCVTIDAGHQTMALKRHPGLDQIETVVVIYAENRSFDNLYGFFPGANGLQHLPRTTFLQRDRDDSVLKELPPIWGGLTAKGVTPPVTEAQTEHLANAPFAIDASRRFQYPSQRRHA